MFDTLLSDLTFVNSVCVYELHFMFSGFLVKSTEFTGAFQNHILKYSPLTFKKMSKNPFIRSLYSVILAKLLC